MDSSFELIISTPSGRVEEMICKQITFKTIEEVRGLLANHTPFMGALIPHIMKVIREDGKVNYFNIDGGFIKFMDNRATILTNSAIDVEKITPESIIKEEKDLQEMIKIAEEDKAKVKKIEVQLDILKNLKELKKEN